MAQAALKRGAFIVFEGIDRCGKSTQSSQLLKHLSSKNIPHKAIRFPERSTNTGKLINEYLTNEDSKMNDRAIHLLFSANRHESKESILSMLNKGETIICDRYAYSGIAYTFAKNATKKTDPKSPDYLSFEWCKNVDNGLPKPDLVIFLQISIEDSKKRGEFGKERYEKEEMQIAVANCYDRLRKGDETWKILDATKSKEDLQKEIAELVEKVIKDSSVKPIQYLA